MGSGLAAVVVALAACGGDDGDSVQQVECGASVFDFSTLSDAPSVSSLPEGPSGAVDDAGAPAFDPAQDWKVVGQSPERVELVRELRQPIENGEGDIRTHESRTLERIAGASNDDTWLLMSAGPCTPRLSTDDDLGAADLTLADRPSPAATSIELLVRERACASGESAEGRIELVELAETAEEIRLRIGVEPRDGDQDCPGNPPTSFTVELSTPLGDREVVDASVVPSRPLTVDGIR